MEVTTFTYALLETMTCAVERHEIDAWRRLCKHVELHVPGLGLAKKPSSKLSAYQAMQQVIKDDQVHLKEESQSMDDEEGIDNRILELANELREKAMNRLYRKCHSKC